MIEAVLFDADGVVQTNPATWLHTLESLCPPAEDPSDFVAAVFRAEGPALVGQADFRDTLAALLAERGCVADVDSVLEIWHAIQPSADAFKRVATVRDGGRTVALATNQQSYRLAFMRTELGYNGRFDRIFASCEMGVRKPDSRFFATICADLGVGPNACLFVDDKPENVAAARSIGMKADLFDLADGVSALEAVLDHHGIPSS